VHCDRLCTLASLYGTPHSTVTTAACLGLKRRGQLGTTNILATLQVVAKGKSNSLLKPDSPPRQSGILIDMVCTWNQQPTRKEQKRSLSAFHGGGRIPRTKEPFSCRKVSSTVEGCWIGWRDIKFVNDWNLEKIHFWRDDHHGVCSNFHPVR